MTAKADNLPPVFRAVASSAIAVFGGQSIELPLSIRSGHSASHMKCGRQRERTFRRPLSAPRVNGGTPSDRRPGPGFAQGLMTCRLLETMARQPIASGTVHRMPADFRKAIESDSIVTDVWASITPLARNEWICWVTSAKKDETRNRRIEVGLDKMRKGMRRPCCWPGCPHR